MRRRRLIPLSRRMIVGVVVLGCASLVLAWILRGPLLLNTIRDEITSHLATSLDATVECGEIRGDPFGEVVLTGLSIHNSWFRIVDGELTLDLDAGAITSGDADDAVRSAHLFAHRIDADLDFSDTASSEDDGSKTPPPASPSKPILPGGLSLHARDLRLAGAVDLHARDARIEIHDAAMTDPVQDSRIEAELSLRDARWQSVTTERIRADVVWQNHECVFTKIELSGLRQGRSGGSACDAHGKGRIDLPRGRARRVARVHWELEGKLTPNAIEALGEIEPIRHSPFRTHGSVKLPIQYGEEEEYLAGKVRFDVDSLHASSFRRPLQVRAEAEIDGLGLLIFNETRIRSAAHDFIEVRGRYPLHRYGRPDLRISVDIPDLEPWHALHAEIPKRGSLQSTLRVRGNKKDPQIRWKATARVGSAASGFLRSVATKLGATPLRAMSGPVAVDFELRGTGRRPEIRRIEIDSPELRVVGRGQSPIALATGIAWGERIVSVVANDQTKNLDLLGVWQRWQNKVAFRLRCLPDAVRVLEARLANSSLIGLSSPR